MAGKPIESKVTDGREYIKCYGPFHKKPTWVPIEDFYVITCTRANGEKYRYRRRRCKHCLHFVQRGTKYQGKNKGAWKYSVHGFVPVEKMQPHLEELANRCGSVKDAAAYVGVSPVSYLAWQGRLKGKSKQIKNMHRVNALTILVALKKKREEQKDILITKKLRKDQRRRGYCAHCGCRDSNYTIGCLGCMWRRQRRKNLPAVT